MNIKKVFFKEKTIDILFFIYSEKSCFVKDIIKSFNATSKYYIYRNIRIFEKYGIVKKKIKKEKWKRKIKNKKYIEITDFGKQIALGFKKIIH